MEDDGDAVDCKMLLRVTDADARLAGANAFANNEEQQMIIAAVVRGIGITVGVTVVLVSRGVKIARIKRKLRGTT